MTFDPPWFSDAGSYWCRNKTNHSDIAEGILIYEGMHSYVVTCSLEVNMTCTSVEYIS